ncbi:MAG TPA: SMP-30/gluconolactonase/LRE family protein [Devosia sp.]|jgi:sugar lactone lactonase YvrE/DNA-binding IclR family transcriptional regulator|uniref:SMP-30/gluconolactonase/LRE family protein n=1 Tax=Devosia sp. TaxID=1871048 RepID=UPI002DDCB868|nr:SMP-30/gluconolactonase/LRE family protein [Devosia sp.]HEV2518203.1 SMP-30/gluconolactonase/LRE family protein [Devosia sp.]
MPIDAKQLGGHEMPMGTSALGKGLYVLDLLGEVDRPQRFTQLLKLTGFPKGTLHRILEALMEFRLIRFNDADQTYRLGPRLFELAHKVWDEFDLRGAAAPELDRLADLTHETVSLCEIESGAILYIDRRLGADAFGFRIEVGRRAPLHCTSGGKALLAFLAPHRQHDLIAELRNSGDPTKIPPDEPGLLADLGLTRARGYALSIEEHVAGVVSVAAPVLDHRHEPIAAIGVSGPRERISVERLHTIGRDLMEAARRISGNVGATAMSINAPDRPRIAVAANAECVLPVAAHLGEGPIWSDTDSRLVWLDILAPAVHVFDPATGQDTTTKVSRMVTAIAARAAGGYAVMTQNGLELLDIANGELTPVVDPEADIETNRFNDAKCDRRGRFWAGSMALDASRPAGSLYSIEADGKWRRHDTGFTVSNGMGWSPDDRLMYFADSAEGCVFAYDFDIEAGTLSNRRSVIQIPPVEGKPDGLTVDAEGYIWVAVWDGWAVRRYAPDGRLDRVVGVPVPRPSSCCFGGDRLETLYITSGRIRLAERMLVEAPLSGGIFAIDAGVRGQPSGTFGR